MSSLAVGDVVQELSGTLRELGLTDGDDVFVHSSMVPLGFLLRNFTSEELCSMLLRALRGVVGEHALVGSLTGSWETARNNLPFEVYTTKVSKDLGLFPEFLRSLAETTRTLHPVYSLCFNGADDQKECILDGIQRYAFGSCSPWQKMVENNFKIVFFGLESLLRLTLIHHVEQRVGVPYCYNKIFQNKVFRGTEEIDGPFIYLAPYRNLALAYDDLREFTDECLRRGAIKRATCKNIPIIVGEIGELYHALERRMYDNPHCLLKNVPKYVRGVIPTDV